MGQQRVTARLKQWLLGLVPVFGNVAGFGLLACALLYWGEVEVEADKDMRLHLWVWGVLFCREAASIVAIATVLWTVAVRRHLPRSMVLLLTLPVTAATAAFWIALGIEH